MLDVQRALEEERRELSAEQRKVQEELAKRRRGLQADERRLKRKLEEEQAQLQHKGDALREEGRRQRDAEKRLKAEIERVRREGAALKQQQSRSEKELRDRDKRLQDKEHGLRRQFRELQDNNLLARPEHWSPRSAGRGPAHKGGALALVPVRDQGVLSVLQELLCGTGIGAGGRDQQESGRYSRLKLAGAWRVENDDLYSAFVVSRRRVLSFCTGRPLRGEGERRKARIRSELHGSARKLPWEMEKGCNEVRLLHGTKPGAKGGGGERGRERERGGTS